MTRSVNMTTKEKNAAARLRNSDKSLNNRQAIEQIISKRPVVKKPVVVAPTAIQAGKNKIQAERNKQSGIAPVTAIKKPVDDVKKPVVVDTRTDAEKRADEKKQKEDDISTSGTTEQKMNQAIVNLNKDPDDISFGKKKILADVDSLERVVKERKKQLEIKNKQQEEDTRQQREAVSRNKSAIISATTSGREGFIANAGFGAGVSRGATRRQDSLVRQNESNVLAMEESKAKLADFRTRGLTELAAQEADRLTELINATDRNELELRAEGQENTKTVLEFAKQTGALAYSSDESLMDMSTQTSIPLALFVSAREADKKVMEAKGLDKPLQQLGLNKNMKEIADYGKTDNEIAIAGFKNMLAGGVINQAQFDKAVANELGTTKQFEWKTADGQTFIHDPDSGKYTAVRTDVNSNNLAPSVADIGSGTITQDYGSPVFEFNPGDHKLLQTGGYGTPGRDIDGSTGDAILSFTSGTVVFNDKDNGYGFQVGIKDAKGNVHKYSHLRESPNLAFGQTVGMGDNIGFMGNSGNVFDMQGNKVDNSIDTETGSHLDYRVWAADEVNGSRWADPADFIGKEQPKLNNKNEKIAQSWSNRILADDAKFSDIIGDNKEEMRNRVVSIMDDSLQGKLTQTHTNLKKSFHLIDGLLNHPGYKDAVGLPHMITNPFGFSVPASDARGFKVKVKQLEALLFLKAVEQMRGLGQLTDMEGAKLAISESPVHEIGVKEGDYETTLKDLKIAINIALVNIGSYPETTKKDSLGILKNH